MSGLNLKKWLINFHSDEIMMAQILFGLILGVCMIITISACITKKSGKIDYSSNSELRDYKFLIRINPLVKQVLFRSPSHIHSASSKREASNDEPPSYDSIDFSKTELPTYDDIRSLK